MMNVDTLVALHGSIAKWEAIVAGTGIDLGAINCPLCRLFLNRLHIPHLGCSGCPVMERTGKSYCEDTPYEEYVAGSEEAIDPEHRLPAARAELAFLRSLLPEGKT